MAKEKKEKKPKKEKKEKPEKSEKKGKGGLKKLLIPLIGLVVIAAGAFAVIKFVLPNLGGGDGGEKIPKKLEAYVVEEDTVPSLDTILEEGEGQFLVNRGPGKTVTKSEDSSEEIVEEKYTYLYEVTSPSTVMNRYLDLLLGEEQGFSLIDETYLVQEERPELVDEEDSFAVARASTKEDSLFVLAAGWSEVSGVLVIRVSVPEGKLHYPEKQHQQPALDPASLTEQLEQLQTMSPSDLALPGSSMSEYDIYPVEGFVTIDDVICRRFNIYSLGSSGDIAGIIFYSGDMSRIYRMDPNNNSVITQLK